MSSVHKKELESTEARVAARQAALATREQLLARDRERAKNSGYAKALKDKVTYQALRTVQETDMPVTKIGLCEGFDLEVDARSQGLLQTCREKDLDIKLKPIVRQEGVYYIPVVLQHKFQALAAPAYVCVHRGDLDSNNPASVSYYYVISEVLNWIYMRWTERGSILENCQSVYIRSQMIEFFKYADQGLPYWSAHEDEYRTALAQADTTLPPLDDLLG